MSEQATSILVIFCKLLSKDPVFWSLAISSLGALWALPLWLRQRKRQRQAEARPFPPPLPEGHPVRTELTVLPADEPRSQTVGFRSTERVGVAAANTGEVTRMVVDVPKTRKSKPVKKKVVLVKRQPKKKAGPRSRFDRLGEDD